MINYNKAHPKRQAGKLNPMYGRHHSQKTKLRMSKNKSGKNNNRYGAKWYYNPITLESKSFLPNEKIPVNWIQGRKIKSKKLKE